MISKQEQYKILALQIKNLIAGEKNVTANMANICAAIKDNMNFFWVGFYVCNDNTELVLAPFQGPVACTRIAYGRGVCGTAWKEQRTIIVPNVEDFKGHIACSSLSKSEIVVPVMRGGACFGVLDIDSLNLNTFDNDDKEGLENIVKIFEESL